MIPDYLALDSVEVINTTRLRDYAANIGTGIASVGGCTCGNLWPSDFVDCRPGDPDCDIEHYSTPAGRDGIENPAPWYDPDVPESYAFAGLLPLDFEGMEDNPRTRAVSTSITGGGAAGPSRVTPRTVTITALVLGAHEAATAYGLAWLNEVLSGCTTSGAGQKNCGGSCMEMFLACPPDDAGKDSEFRDRYLRTFRNVVLTDGPKVTERNGEVLTVEFTLSVGGAWAWTKPKPVDLSGLERDDFDPFFPLPRDDSEDCITWCLHRRDDDEDKPTPPVCLDVTRKCPGAALAVPVDPDAHWTPPEPSRAPHSTPYGPTPAGWDNPNGYDIDVARRIYRVGRKRGVSPKIMLSAFETGIVESRMRNLDYGDRDSVGVFQQRPSQGWGTRAQCMDVVHASNRYFDAAIRSDEANPDQTAGQLAQSVQRSAYPDRYDKAQDEAEALLAHVAALEEETSGEESDTEESAGEDDGGCVWWPALTEEERRRLHGDDCDKCRTAPCDPEPDCTDPRCAPPTPPVPTGPESCFCTAMVQLDEIYELDLSGYPAWFGSTPMIEVHAGSDDLHNVTIEFFERNVNHSKLTAEEVIAENRCKPAAVYNVAYVPKDSVVEIDGQVNRAWVVCGGVCKPSRDVYGRDGGPITWAELGCDKYVVRVSTDALRTPAPDAEFMISLSEREFTAGQGGWNYRRRQNWDPCR